MSFFHRRAQYFIHALTADWQGSQSGCEPYMLDLVYQFKQILTRVTFRGPDIPCIARKFISQKLETFQDSTSLGKVIGARYPVCFFLSIKIPLSIVNKEFHPCRNVFSGQAFAIVIVGESPCAGITASMKSSTVQLPKIRWLNIGQLTQAINGRTNPKTSAIGFGCFCHHASKRIRFPCVIIPQKEPVCLRSTIVKRKICNCHCDISGRHNVSSFKGTTRK
mmetsp:Transcript_26354/g.55078  ORF Transcript_26354/g.55078 Transcript_26354/m.55078 type:complete len:221 (-) Transcript_26354:247-909(-)